MCNLIKVPWKFKDGYLISPSTSLVRWNTNNAMQLICNNSNFDTMILYGGILIDHYPIESHESKMLKAMCIDPIDAYAIIKEINDHYVLIGPFGEKGEGLFKIINEYNLMISPVCIIQDNTLVKICKFYLCYKDKSGHILYI